MSASGGNEGGDGDNTNARPLRDMQELMRFAIQGSDGTNPSVEMDPTRRAWLEEAIRNSSVDVIQQMLQSIQRISTDLAQLDQGEGDIEEVIDLIDNLKDTTSDLDMAADFHKIGGFDLLPRLLLSVHPELKMKGAELVAELVQNHPYCQKSALELNILETLVNTLNNNSVSDKVKVKTLYAVSCLIRHNPEGLQIFEQKLDGYSALLRVMQSSSREEGPRLRMKAAFLLSSIIQEGPEVKEALLIMGFVEQFVGLLHQEHDLSHEHLLSSLVYFVDQFEPAVKECRRSELQLRPLLQNRLKLIGTSEEYKEEANYCKQLLDLCFLVGGSEDSNDGCENDR